MQYFIHFFRTDNYYEKRHYIILEDNFQHLLLMEMTLEKIIHLANCVPLRDEKIILKNNITYVICCEYIYQGNISFDYISNHKDLIWHTHIHIKDTALISQKKIVKKHPT